MIEVEIEGVHPRALVPQMVEAGTVGKTSTVRATETGNLSARVEKERDRVIIRTWQVPIPTVAISFR